MNTYAHIPVLLNEVIEYLEPQPGQNVIDATLGGGGYTQAILKEIGETGKLLAVDLDKDAIENFSIQDTKHKIQNTILAQGNFSKIDQIAKNHNFPAPDGIVADLGLSSYELEHRGISFQTNQPLDMRFDLSQPLDAKFVLNNYEQEKLIKIFEEYGEEKFSRQITRKVIGIREEGREIKHTKELCEIIKDALPKPFKHKADDSARRIFQALRIEVNHELSNLEEFLPKAFDLLAPGGRLVVVSFHSLEDRIVKQFFAGLAKGCVCPPEFPQCLCGQTPKAKILTKKPVTANSYELAHNSKSKPAKLRAVEKI